MTSERPRSAAGDRPLDPKKLLHEAVAGGPTPADPAFAGWQPPSLEELDARFGELELVELIGRGGMGAVYRARQPKLDRDVALKVLPPELAKEPAFEQRFLREARALAGLQHPRILTIYDFGERDGLFYLVTEFVEGMNLRQLMDMGELSPEEALRITPQICEALQFAHDRGVVHRDIKPENVLIDTAGEVKIADFGLARIVGADAGPALTRSTQVLGTPHYMAPEQWREGKAVDHRADIYSVGVVLYEMLTGDLPLGHFDPPSRRRGVPKRLDAVVQRSLAQRPEQRYQQAREVGEDLRRQEPGPARDGAAPRSAAGKARSPLSLRLAWAMLLLAIVGVAGVGVAMKLRELDRAQVEAELWAAVDAEAARWAEENNLNRSPEELLPMYYEQHLLPEWQRRRDEAEQAGVAFTEARPKLTDITQPQFAQPSHSLSFLLSGGMGFMTLLFSILGFRSLATIRRRRRGTRGLALAVFTAWIAPLAIATSIPVMVIVVNVSDGDTAVLAGTITAVLLGIGGLAFMFWQHARLRRELT